MHSYRRHSIQRVARQYVDTEFCPCCLLHFASRERLVAHMHEKSRVCLDFVIASFPKLPHERIRELDDAERERLRGDKRAGRRRGWASTPAFRLPGPQPKSELKQYGRRSYAL